MGTYNESRIKEFIRRFIPQHESIKVLSSARNTVVEVVNQEGSFILKVKDANSTYGKMTRNEVDWIRYLHDNGIGVPELVSSSSGQTIELLESELGSLIGYCYKKVPLDTNQRQYWSDSRFVQQLGVTMGRMHTLADSYSPPDPENIQAWDSSEWLKNPASYFHPSHVGVADTIRKVKTLVSALPQRKGSYGLIHDDLHSGNVFKVGDELAIIDFECLQMNWYLAEIASTLLFRTWIGPAKERLEVKEDATRFLCDILIGYTKEHSLQPRWFEHISLFLKLREISLFADYAGVDVDRTEDSLVQYLYRSIRENRLFLDIDFERAT